MCVEMNSKGLSESLWRSAVKWGWSLHPSGPNGFNHSVVISSFQHVNRAKTFLMKVPQRLVPLSELESGRDDASYHTVLQLPCLASGSETMTIEDHKSN